MTSYGVINDVIVCVCRLLHFTWS